MFHASNLGSFAGNLRPDIDGQVPEKGDGPWDFTVDHGSERTHDDEGNLTEYGRWWVEQGFPEWRDEAITATEAALRSLGRWQEAS